MAFVDWNAQIHGFGFNRLDDPNQRTENTLDRTLRGIARLLVSEASQCRFRVDLRFYHGWHKGFEPTENRRAMITAVARADFSAMVRHPSVLISPNIAYGDLLLDALELRCHGRQLVHLPNTLRQQGRGSELTEKMVDTALAVDLLAWARNSQNGWALLLGDDDDLVPPAFVAEAWTKPSGGRILLVRHQRGRQAFLKLDGLLFEMPR